MLYEILILGAVPPRAVTKLTTTIKDLLQGFELDDNDVAIRSAPNAAGRSRRAAIVAAYFGGQPELESDLINELLTDGVPIIPTIAHDERYEDALPAALAPINGLRRRTDDPAFIELATALLECIGLLRRQRRVFVSYRRDEAQVAAIELYESLAQRGFSVFLDTHSIRPGENFQDELWHQMCDCDVVIMLDTQTFFDSRWTREEIAKALAKDLQILRVIWPNVTPTKLTKLTNMADILALSAEDLSGPPGSLPQGRLDEIALKVELLRSRSIASRYRTMSDRLESDIVRIGGKVHGIGAHRAISLELLNGEKLWAYPVVGIPTAETLHDIAEKAIRAEKEGTPVLVYDHIGIRDRWAAHLAWLADKIPAVRWVKLTQAAYMFAGMES